MERHRLETTHGDFAGLDASEWFSLGSGTVGARVLAAARIAAVLHEDALTGESEGVGVLERMMLLDGVTIGDEATP